MAVGAIISAILKKLVLKGATKKAAEEAEREGASGALLSAIASGIGKGEVEEVDEVEAPEEAPEPVGAEQRAAIDIARGRPDTLPQMPTLPPDIQRIATAQPAGVQAPTAGAQPTTTPPTVPPGILAGLKGGVLNIPTVAGQIPEERVGRRTAFAAGETLGDFLRANLLKLPTADPLSATVPVIDPQTGQVVFQKPRTGVFQPRPQTEAEALQIIRKNIKSQLAGEDVLRGEQKVGDIVDRGGKKWKIVGFDKDGEPLVEEIK